LVQQLSVRKDPRSQLRCFIKDEIIPSIYLFNVFKLYVVIGEAFQWILYRCFATLNFYTTYSETYFLQAWEACAECWYSESLSDYEEELLLSEIQTAANAAHLFGDLEMAVRAWILYYQVAEKFEREISQLIGMYLTHIRY